MAVEEMGDPTAVGAQLDQIHRPEPQYRLLGLTVLIALAGAVLRVWLTADWDAYNIYIDPLRTLFAVALGCVALFTGYFLDASRIGEHGRGIYLVAILAGILELLVSPAASGVSYYTRYIALCYPAVYVLWVYTFRGKGWLGLALAIAGGIPPALICISAPSMLGLSMLLTAGFLLLLGAAWEDWFGLGRRKTMGVVILCTAVSVGAVLCRIVLSGYGIWRLAIAFHPERDSLGMGYPGNAIRKALGVSQWFGEGAWSTATSAAPFEGTVTGCGSDAFLTTIIYKLGWLPFLMVIAAFAVLIGLMLHRCLRHKSRLGRALVLAVVVTLSIQALFSIAWSLGFTLVSSAFPLIVGNLNTVVDMGLIGIALSVFRGESIARDSLCGEGSSRPHYHIKLVIQKY